MGSRDAILNAVRKNKPAGGYRANYDLPASSAERLDEQYQASLERNGGALYRSGTLQETEAILARTFGDAVRVCSLVDGIQGSRGIHADDDPHKLADIEVAILRGVVGVAENAAIWVTENDMVKRVLPFIAQNLVIVLGISDIVPTMHEAYARIDVRDSGYGVFIAGPSKTADIEQSLVIGAHGPRSMTVVLTG